MVNQVQLKLDTLPTMSSAAMSVAVATTTYPFSYTTYTNDSPAAFTRPTEFPSVFSFGSAVSCTSSASATASALPSGLPIDRPVGAQAACVISNAAEVNDHAFWDLYACCKGSNMTAFGGATLCTAQCTPGEGQTWQELGECLSERVEAVVCKPNAEEIGNSTNSASTAASGSPTRSASGSGAVTSLPTGAASTMGVVHSTSSKAGLVVFGLLALGSAAGMLL